MRLGFRSLIIAILALWRDLSWKQVAAAAGWTSDRLSKILRRKEMAERDFEWLLPYVRNRPAEVLVAARCIEDLEALERESNLTDEEQEEVERGVLEFSRHLRAVLVDRVRRSRGVPAWDEYPDPSEVEPARWRADSAWKVLAGMKEDVRPVVVKAVREFQTWAVMERVCAEFRALVFQDPKRAASLAELAEVIAATVQGPEGWRRRVRGSAALHRARITEILDGPEAVRAGMEQARQLWDSGSDPDRVLEGSASVSGAAEGVPAAAFLDSLLSGAASAEGVHAAAFFYGRAVPEGGELRPELVDEGQAAGRRREQRGGEGERDKGWAHENVSRAAPAPDLPGPLGPRLPGMVLQEGGKKSLSLLGAARLRLKTLLVRLFRALTGKTQKEFAEALGLDPAVVAQYELGKYDPGLDLLERMAAEADLTVRDGEEALRFLEALRRPRLRAGLGLGDLAGDLAEVVARVDQRLLRLPFEQQAPRAEDRQAVEGLWLKLKDLTEEQQLAVVSVGQEFQSWALVERLCDESEIEASRDLKRAASLARLARAIADRVPGPEGWRKRVRGCAIATEANVLRVVGDLKAARVAFEQAKELWNTGSDPEGLLDPGRILDLEASLCRDERQFDKALKLLDEALAVGRQKARILIKKGFTLEVMGEYAQGIATLLQARPLVEAQGDARLQNILHLNLAVQYCHAHRHAEAVELVAQVRRVAEEMGDAIGSLRGLWLEGRIAVGLGRNALAVRLLDQARQEFSQRDMWYDVALADLEMAPLLLAEGAVAQVKQMAGELVVKFEQQGIHREALAALRLFREAADREEATAELAHRVLEFLFRARWDEGLRFGDRI
jgi:transcriptional regulator with XRE-family HTH domain